MSRADRAARGSPGRAGVGLAARLFLALALVIVAGAGTLLMVAALFGPPVFRARLGQPGGPAVSAQVRDQVEAAFDRALLISLGVGVTVAVGAAVAISWLVARRLAAPVQTVAAAAEQLAAGRYDVPVPDPHLGSEFATLAGAMTGLSQRLRDTEQARRRLTADLAHQLRTPLASLRATVEAVTDGVLPADPATLAVLTDQTERLFRLVDDLEKVSRAQERQLLLQTWPQPLPAVVARCADAVRARFDAAGVALEVRLGPPAPPVRIDADRVAEAVGNLLDNALRHTPRGGRVEVSVGGSGPMARVVVRDSGEGFEPEQAALLFERFHRGPGARPGTGTGLWLTISRAIVEAHGGTLDADSPGPGRGATFTLVLPAAG
jgi:signal transduction histidine kinase